MFSGDWSYSKVKGGNNCEEFTPFFQNLPHTHSLSHLLSPTLLTLTHILSLTHSHSYSLTITHNTHTHWFSFSLTNKFTHTHPFSLTDSGLWCNCNCCTIDSYTPDSLPIPPTISNHPLLITHAHSLTHSLLLTFTYSYSQTPIRNEEPDRAARAGLKRDGTSLSFLMGLDHSPIKSWESCPCFWVSLLIGLRQRSSNCGALPPGGPWMVSKGGANASAITCK